MHVGDGCNGVREECVVGTDFLHAFCDGAAAKSNCCCCCPTFSKCVVVSILDNLGGGNWTCADGDMVRTGVKGNRCWLGAKGDDCWFDAKRDRCCWFRVCSPCL